MNRNRLREINDELQKMIDHPGNATIEDYCRLERERSNLLLALEAEEKMRDNKERIRQTTSIQEVSVNVQSRNI